METNIRLSVAVLVYTEPLGKPTQFTVVTISDTCVTGWFGSRWVEYPFEMYNYLEVVAVFNGNRINTWIRDVRVRALTDEELASLDEPGEDGLDDVMHRNN